ncbi:MAG: helix-turn-helix domain-containing protein [Gammaproteobacteria bacterium]
MVSVTRRQARTAGSTPAAPMEARLLAALERLLESEASFTALSVERLAREAGISRATFYLHFRDKSDLIERLLHRVEDEVVAAGGVWFQHAEDASYADLKRAMHGFMGVYREHRAILRAAAETAAYDDDVDSAYKHMLNRFRSESRAAVARIAARGRAHAELPPQLADVLAQAVDHCYVKLGTTLDGRALDELVEALTWIVWHAIFTAEADAGD